MASPENEFMKTKDMGVREIDDEINGIQCHYAAIDNDQPPLLMLHGVTRRWQTFLPVMHSMSLRWNVFALDFRGHGKSGRRPGRYAVADYVIDTIEFLRSNFNKPVVIYGHSLGAMVAAATAALAPNSVRAVILEDPPMNTMGPQITSNILNSFFRGLSRFAGDSRPVSIVAAELANMPLTDPESGRTLKLSDVRDAAALRFTARSIRNVDPDVFVPILEGRWLEGLNLETIAAGIRCPALLLQADMIAGGMLTDDDAAILTKLAKDLTHMRFPGVGHVIHVAQTTQLINCLHTFAESIRD